MSDHCHPGEVLRDWISEHRKTIQEAAELMGVSRATLNHLLSGVGRITPKLPAQLECMGGALLRCGPDSKWPAILPQHGARNL